MHGCTAQIRDARCAVLASADRRPHAARACGCSASWRWARSSCSRSASTTTRRAQVVIADAAQRAGRADVDRVQSRARRRRHVPQPRADGAAAGGRQERGIVAATAELATFGRRDATARIDAASGRYFAFVDRHCEPRRERVEARRRRSSSATSERPGGAYAGAHRPRSTRRIAQFGADAAHSRDGRHGRSRSAAVVFLLMAFSIALQSHASGRGGAASAMRRPTL